MTTNVTNIHYSKNRVHDKGSPEEANTMQHLDLMVKQASDALLAAQNYANKHGLEFYWSPPNSDTTYYMCGYYRGKGNSSKDKPTEAREWYGEDYNDDEDGWGWYTSSDRC